MTPVPKAPFTDEVIAETAAMQTVGHALEMLSLPARKRVIDWAMARLNELTRERMETNASRKRHPGGCV